MTTLVFVVETTVVHANDPSAGVPLPSDFFQFEETVSSGQHARAGESPSSSGAQESEATDMEMGLALHLSAAMAASNQAVDHAQSISTRTSTTTTRPPLLCPLTEQPLQDPVVNPANGVSYERSAIDCEEDTNLYPPNRVLKDYLHAVQVLQEASATMDSPNTNASSKKARATKDLFALFFCSITGEVLRDPVIDHEGNTYERSAIMDWIQQHGDSPITRNPLSAQQLYDNITLFEVIIQETLLLQQQGTAIDELQAFEMAVSTPGDTGFAQAAYDSSQYVGSLPVHPQDGTTPPGNNDNNVTEQGQQEVNMKDAVVGGVVLICMLASFMGLVRFSKFLLAGD
ncbi:U-box domain-containing protein [Seminavis robusta]|uniref:U-box domain-containing protein n=1 Tax=Seminavis robusta TaxID=568900 RepID=A0A9N8E920_9STRA|nr:U-box domain-containing protein [Seminavis robusta]|eukprot:Sro681_g186400.1 U-box domain-containing protein (343) ;mRNA; f:24753-25781